MDLLYTLFVVLAFLAVVLFLEGSYLVWDAYHGRGAKKIAKRLRAMTSGVQSSAEMSIIKQRLLSDSPGYQRLLLSIPRIHAIDRLLEQGGIQFNVGVFVMMVAGGVAGGYLLALLGGLPHAAAFACAAAGGCLPFLYVLRARSKRLRVIEEQLPNALDLMSRALRAGHSFPSGLRLLGEEMPEPIANEFRIAADELNYGVSLQDALTNLATRIPSTDLRYFVVAVLIQRETGGNLAAILDNISSIIRARLKLLATVRVLSSEGRLSAQILTALPFLLALVINLVNPGFMQLLWTDPLGIKLTVVALVMMVAGIFVMWRIIKIRV